MQGTNHLSAAPRETFGKAAAIAFALALSLSLAACQAKNPQADTTHAPAAAAPATASAAGHCRACTCCHLPRQRRTHDDEDMPPRRPDDSYNKATLRPQYATCVNSGGGETPPHCRRVAMRSLPGRSSGSSRPS